MTSMLAKIGSQTMYVEHNFPSLSTLYSSNDQWLAQKAIVSFCLPQDNILVDETSMAINAFAT